MLKVFANALTAANGKQIPLAGGSTFSGFKASSTFASTGISTTATTLFSVQQNDPTTITGLPVGTRENAIVPFPYGRFKLIQNSYFNSAAVRDEPVLQPGVPTDEARPPRG